VVNYSEKPLAPETQPVSNRRNHARPNRRLRLFPKRRSRRRRGGTGFLVVLVVILACWFNRLDKIKINETDKNKEIVDGNELLDGEYWGYGYDYRGRGHLIKVHQTTFAERANAWPAKLPDYEPRGTKWSPTKVFDRDGKVIWEDR
jgi:hypothetical protein